MFEWPYFPGAISGTLLLTAGWLAAQCWRELRGNEPAGFWGTAAAGLIFLAFDEWFAIHEWEAQRLFSGLGIFNHPDDAIILGYVAVAGALGLLYRNQILRDRRAFNWLCAAAGATAIAGFLDAFGSPYFWLSAVSEEAAELSAGAMAILAMRARLSSARGLGGPDMVPGSLIAERSPIEPGLIGE